MSAIRIFIGIVALSFPFHSSSQDIVGSWEGTLKEARLRLVLNITNNGVAYSSTLDSPDQNAKGIPVTNTIFKDSVLQLTISSLGVTYTAKFNGDTFNGTFAQGGKNLPLVLSKDKGSKEGLNRPQEPKKPYPYYVEEISFQNEVASVSLAGTLSLPKERGKFPAVVLISGSGPQDRNGEIFGHKPFLVISDYLVRKGIAVLRYDDRGVGESSGAFSTATSADLATDVESAVDFLKKRKEIDSSSIGLIGHSEGGAIAPIVASKTGGISFMVLLAAIGVPGGKLLVMQGNLLSVAGGISDSNRIRSNQIRAKEIEIISKSSDTDSLKSELHKFLMEFIREDSDELLPEGMSRERFVSIEINRASTPWMRYFVNFNPSEWFEKVDCPVLAVNGGNDLQVPPKTNLRAIEMALKKGGNTEVTVIEFPKLNHLFQKSKTGLPVEYGQIDQTFSPSILAQITDWILDIVND